MHFPDGRTAQMLLDSRMHTEDHSQLTVTRRTGFMRSMGFPRLTMFRLAVILGLTIAVNFIVIGNVTDIIWTNRFKIRYRRDNVEKESICDKSNGFKANLSSLYSGRGLRANFTAPTDSTFESEYHYRFYMNPVKAFLMQDKWNKDFINEISMLNSEKHQMDIVARIPKVSRANEDSSEIPTPNETDLITNRTQYRDISCSKLFANDFHEFIKTEIYQMHTDPQLPTDYDVYNATRNCEQFKQSRQYILHSITNEEENFPLAYSILVYKDTLLLERLLRAIYRPQNIYCIHVDKKSSVSVYQAAQSLAECFDNVFLASRRLSVEWGGFGVLEGDLVCLKELWEEGKRRNRDWKYFINLTGQEFPLKTNWEIVQILKTYNGAVDVGATISR